MKRTANRPSLTSLETLCWIAKLGTFTAAAERVHTTQSAVSTRMKELEASLGVEIFRHGGRKAELTIEGRRIVRRAELLLEAADRLAFSSGENAAFSGVLRVGVGEYSIAIFAELMAQVRRDLPDLCFEVDLDLAANVRHKLDLGILDLIVVNGKVEHASLRSVHLGPGRFVWVVSPQLARRAGRAATREELLGECPLWSVARPSSAYSMTMDSLRAHDANLDNVNFCNRVLAMVEIVARGGGVALLPESVIADRLQRRELVAVPGIEPVGVDLTMACRRMHNQPIVDRMMDAAARRSPRTIGKRDRSA